MQISKLKFIDKIGLNQIIREGLDKNRDRNLIAPRSWLNFIDLRGKTYFVHADIYFSLAVTLFMYSLQNKTKKSVFELNANITTDVEIWPSGISLQVLHSASMAVAFDQPVTWLWQSIAKMNWQSKASSKFLMLSCASWPLFRWPTASYVTDKMETRIDVNLQDCVRNCIIWFCRDTSCTNTYA